SSFFVLFCRPASGLLGRGQPLFLVVPPSDWRGNCPDYAKLFTLLPLRLGGKGFGGGRGGQPYPSSFADRQLLTGIPWASTFEETRGIGNGHVHLQTGTIAGHLDGFPCR